MSKIVIIGAGNIGSVLIARLVGTYAADGITATHPKRGRRAKLRTQYGVRVSASNVAPFLEAGPAPEAAIICLKQPMLREVMAELRGKIPKETLVISVVAGVPMAIIAAGLEHELVARAMPNTPGEIGKGITVWTALGEVGEGSLDISRKIFDRLGKQVFVSEEEHLNRATPLFGCLPAFAFLVAEAVKLASEEIGFPEAEDLILQGLQGSFDYALAKNQDRSLKDLGMAVASRGGATERMTSVLVGNGFQQSIVRSFLEAYRHTQGLGRLVTD